MLELSPMDVKTLLVGLVRDSVFDLGPKHHLRAVHEVVHHVFKLRHQRLPINDVEVDLGISGNLDSNVTLNVINEPAKINLVVKHPLFLVD